MSNNKTYKLPDPKEVTLTAKGVSGEARYLFNELCWTLNHGTLTEKKSRGEILSDIIMKATVEMASEEWLELYSKMYRNNQESRTRKHEELKNSPEI